MWTDIASRLSHPIPNSDRTPEADCYVDKPFTAHELLAAVQQIVGETHTHGAESAPRFEMVSRGMHSPDCIRATTTVLEQDVKQTSPFDADTQMLIYVEGEPDPLVCDALDIETLVLGRTDPRTGESVDVDLSMYGAAEKGVSRRHAEIVWHYGALHIVDRGSQNGTFLNGQRLVAHHPYLLRDGDRVRLGHLELRIRFGQHVG